MTKPLLTLSVERNDLLAMQSLTSRDLSRYVLQGVQFEFSGEDTLLVATNGIVLGVLNCGKAVVDGKPKPFLTDASLVKLFKPSKQDKQLITIEVFETEVAYSLNGVKIVGRLIEGNYPNWRDVIPKTAFIDGKYAFNMLFLQTLLRACQLLTKGSACVELIPHADENGKFSEVAPYSVFFSGCKRFYGALMPYRASEPEIPKWINREIQS